MSPSDTATLQTHLSQLEQENRTLLCRLAQQQEQDWQKQVAIAREQEQAAQARAAELARSNEALQQTIDILASLNSFDDFIPAVLTIVAQTFSATDCGYYEHTQGETVYLRYWFSQGTVLNPTELQLLDPLQHPVLLQLANGFTVPLEHLHGTTVRDRTRPVIVDHTTAQTVPAFHTFAVSQGWELELNQPLLVDGKADGALVIYRTLNQPFTEAEIMLAEALAKQLALAMQASRLADQARHQAVETAIAREQEQAAQERAAELAKANEALQATIDALTAISDLDEFVPAALQIVAQTFKTESCAFYEHSEDITVYLRYWLWGDSVLHPHDLVMLDSESFAIVRHLAAGFTVPDAYLGMSVRDRTRAVVIDHCRETPVPEFDRFACNNGWATELNVPLVVDGKADGALVIYRPVGATYTPSEIGLAEALGKQLALAMQASRLASDGKAQAVKSAIAREQEKAAQARAVELAKANDALRRSARDIAQNSSIQDILPLFLREAIAVAGAASGAVLRRVGASEFEFVAILQGDDLIHNERLKQHPFYNAVKQVSREDPTGWFTRLAAGETLWRLTDDEQAGPLPESGEYHRPHQQRSVWDIPYKIGDRVAGYLGLAFVEVKEPSEIVTETVAALATQVGLALELTALAEKAKQAAIVREQEQAALERAAELAKANEALKRSLRSLSTNQSLDHFLGNVLMTLAEQFGSTTAEYWSHADGKTAYIEMMAREGRIYSQAEIAKVYPDHPGVAGYRVPLEQIHGEPLNRRTQHFIIEDLSDYPPARDVAHWMFERGLYKEINIPLNVGEQTIGALSVKMRRGFEITTEKVELAWALANQVALALELTRLADEAKQAAIAREQEKATQARVAELAKANATLRRSLSWLAQEGNLNQFLERVLLEIAATTQADLAYLFVLQEPERMLELTARVIDGAISDRPTPTEPAIFSAPFSAEITPGFRLMEEQNLFLTLDMAMLQPELRAISWPDNIDWHLREGRKQVASLVLKAGDRSVGFLGLGFREPRAFSQEERELVIALANQASLAILLIQLAEEAKQAAIAREQEKAAQERAAELAKANEVLRRSLNTLVVEQTLPGYLGHILTAITHQLDASSAVLWLYDQEQRTANLSLVFNGQTVKPASQTHHPNAKLSRDYSSPERAHAWETMIHQRQSELLVIAGETRMTPSQRDYLLGQGIWGILSIPLVLGDRTEGTFAIHFHAPRSFRDEELELVQTLANQAALAIQMAQLAEQAKETALLEERNRLAGEIHDTLAQAFTGISMQLSVAKWLLQQDPLAVDQILDRINDIAQGGLAEARRSVWTLYPVEPAYADLAQQLSRCVKQMTSGTAMQVEVQISGSPCPLSPLVGKNLLRIGQEAITNTLKHADATLLKIHLTYTEATLCLYLQDNGRGFPTDLDRSGFGLISMSDRADRINGHLTINSQPGQGTEIGIQVPLP